MAKKKNVKKDVPKYVRKQEVVDMDMIAMNSDSEDESQLLQEDDSYEVGVIDDNSDDDEIDISSAKNWDKIAEKERQKLELQSKAWGKNRETYYGADTTYLDDKADEEAELEESAALELQHQQAAALNEHDFGLDEIISSKKAKKTKTSKLHKEAIDTVMNNFDLTKDDKIKQVVSSAPELITLLDNYTIYMKELRTELQPMINMIKNKEEDLHTVQNISILELRFQMMIGYCVHVAFYLLLKAEGGNVQEHPVMKRLVQFHMLIEKLTPVHTFLKFKVEKHLSGEEDEDDVGSVDLNDDDMFDIDEDNEDEDDLLMDIPIPPTKKSKTKVSVDSAPVSVRPTISKEERDRMLIEENHYMKLADKTMKKRKRTDDIENDFVDLSVLEKFEKRQKKKAHEASQNLDFDKSSVLSSSYSDDDFDEDMGPSQFDDSDVSYYEQMAAQASQQTKAKKTIKTLTSSVKNEKFDLNLVGTGDRRGAGLKIIKNRGLTRAPKKHSHARTALRAKHEKALTKRKAAGAKEYSGQVNDGYSGESTGIKKTLIRSRKIQS